MKSIIILLLVSQLVLSIAANDCQNGLTCKESETCVTSELGAGLKGACAPAPQATLCKDKSHACPFGFTCDTVDAATKQLVCASESGAVLPLLSNNYAVPTASLQASAYPTICPILKNHMASFCVCTDGEFAATVNCSVVLPMNVDTVSVDFVVSPCGTPGSPSSSLFVKYSDRTFNVASVLADITADFEREIPVPDVKFAVPFVGEVGLDVLVSLKGDIDSIHATLGLDMCLTPSAADSAPVCGQDLLPGQLPIYIFKDVGLSFGSLCGTDSSVSSVSSSGAVAQVFQKFYKAVEGLFV